MEISLPQPTQNDIYSYGFDKNLNRGVENVSNFYDDKVSSENTIYDAPIVGGTIIYGYGDDIFKVNKNYGIWLGKSDYASAPFKVSMAGALVATSVNISGTGIISGWTVGATTLTATGISLDAGNKKITLGASAELILDGTNKRIESSNYVSGYAGSGFRLDSNLLEVGNIACRGIFRSAVMQYDNTFAYAGNQIVAKGADVLKTDMTVADNSTVEIENDSSASAWVVGDILKLDDANDTEWLEITVVTGNVYTCNRDKKGDYAAGANPAWKAGQAVVNYGQSGDGGIYTTASEANSPYLSIFTHAGSPWTDLTTRLRIGNLNGYLGYTTDLYGIAIGEATKYLKYDTTDGLQLRGNFKRNDIHWFTLFESLDGYLKQGVGTIVVNSNMIEINSGTTSGNTMELLKMTTFSANQLSWAKERIFETKILFWTDTLQEILIVSGGEGAGEAKIGFKIIDNDIYGISENSTSVTTLLLESNFTANSNRLLKAIFYPGDRVDFYINNTLINNISTNLPVVGDNLAPYLLNISVKTNEAVFKRVQLSFWDFWQSI